MFSYTTNYAVYEKSLIDNTLGKVLKQATQLYVWKEPTFIYL